MNVSDVRHNHWTRRRRTRPQRLGLWATLLGMCLALSGPAQLAAQPRGGDKGGKGGKDSASTERDDADAAGGLYDCPEKQRRGRYVVSLSPETSLDDLIKWAMTFHCKNFVYSSEIGKRSAKVTIMTPEKMTASQAWRVFLVALQSMNLTVVPKGNVLEIIENAKAKQQPLPIFTDGGAPASDQVVRVILRPDYLSVEDLSAVLTELKSQNGDVKAYPNAGLVVVTDFGSNVSKMANMMMTVDQAVSGEQLYMLRLEYADANEMATKLTEILGTKGSPAGTGGSSGSGKTPKRSSKKGDVAPKATPTGTSAADVGAAIPSKIIPDERTNLLIVLGSEAAYLRVKALVNRLDVGIDVEGAGRIHVYLLENADAEEMANTLQAVITGIQRPSSSSGGAARRTPTPAGATGDSAEAFEGQVRVTHDKPTNSLVVVASVKDFVALRDVIRKLDTPRPQVYIEATIVEIGIDNSLQLGTTFHGGVPFGDGHILLGGVQHTELSSLNLATLLSASGLLGGAIGAPLENAEQTLGRTIPSFGVLFQALATNSDVNVLSSPHVLTTDNEEAEISVGQNIPYQSALVGGLAGGAGQTGGFFPTQSIQRQDVALTLKITPHINASAMVRLEIDLEISDIASQDFQGLGPSWAKRTIKDTVVVRDQQSVVIGGLIADKSIASRSKVPILGDIPVLGKLLFSFNTKRKEKRNLLVVLTPHIVQEQMDLERIVERRVREQREFIRTFSTFDQMEYRTDVDYRRKRGVLEEINREIEQSEADAELQRELEMKMIRIPSGAIDYEAELGEAEGEDGQEGQEGQTDDGGGEADAAGGDTD